jgi:hypothetical protein
VCEVEFIEESQIVHTTGIFEKYMTDTLAASPFEYIDLGIPDDTRLSVHALRNRDH